MIKTQLKHTTLGGRGRAGVGVGVGVGPIFSSSHEPKCSKNGGGTTTNGPISVLDTRSPSPSPSTSTSTLSSFNTNPHANLLLGGKDWLQPPIDPVLYQNFNLEHEYWNGFPESAGKQDDYGYGACGKGLNFTTLAALSGYGNEGENGNIVLVNNNGDGFHRFVGEVEPLDQKVEFFSPHSSCLLFGSEQEPPNNVKTATFVEQQYFPAEMGSLIPSGCNDQQVVYQQVCEAAELIEAGNFSNAQGILARLNHVLAPTGKPFLRSAFYVKQALELAFTAHHHSILPAPFDTVLKMGVYKVFSEVSPIIHFMNFTANQLLLEALGDAHRIHIIDFDIGFGTHWSSLLQELPRRSKGGTSLKITAFASPSTHHSLQITLIHENLTQFANDLGIIFELEVVNIDSFDLNINSVSSLRSSESEVIAVNFPIWSFTSHPSAFPSYLCLIKKLSPKILVALSGKCEQIEVPFPNHVLNTLQYYEAVLESVDAANVSCDAANKIEKYIFQPRIESSLMGRLLYPGPGVVPAWRSLFASVGFWPASVSNFGASQAECLLKRMQVGGFHVERKQASLSLCWRRCELLTVSAWNC